MSNRYNATRVYYHPDCGYFKGRQAFDDYYSQSKIETSVHITDFKIFDSVFESEVHKFLSKWCETYNKNLADSNQLLLLNQIQVDLSQPAFCQMGYKIDFLVARRKRLGFSKEKTKDLQIQCKSFGMRYADLACCDVDTHNSLLIEAKGLFTAEARYKHLLLEANGWQHGKHIEIVQQIPQYVARGKKCYRTLTLTQLENKLDLRFIKGEQEKCQ
jgi:hypothetical protein